MARHQHRDHLGGASQRQLRVGELVRHALAEMLTRGEVHDPVLEGHMITVPEVRMTPDLRLATIYVMPLGGRDQTEVLAALEAEIDDLAQPSPLFERARQRHVLADLRTRDDFAARAAYLARYGAERPDVPHRGVDAKGAAQVAADLLVGRPHVIVRREFSKFEKRPTRLPQ